MTHDVYSILKFEIIKATNFLPPSHFQNSQEISQ